MVTGVTTPPQKPNGEAELSYSDGQNKRFVRAATFHDLIQKNTAEVQLNFIRPVNTPTPSSLFPPYCLFERRPASP